MVEGPGITRHNSGALEPFMVLFKLLFKEVRREKKRIKIPLVNAERAGLII